MILRRHRSPLRDSVATYSDCRAYRYALERRWAEGPLLLYIMLNPSTASERVNDPTVERCERRARALGYAALGVVNLFAWRATRPADLRRAPEPVGPENDAAIGRAAAAAATILCAWGVHGAHLGRGAEVARRLRAAGHPLHALGTTKKGHPRHPLYLPYATPVELWSAPASGAPVRTITRSDGQRSP